MSRIIIGFNTPLAMGSNNVEPELYQNGLALEYLHKLSLEGEVTLWELDIST